MKRFLSLIVCGLATAGFAQVVQPPVAAPADTPYGVVWQDGNQKVWQRVTWIPDPFGSFTAWTNSYVELQTARAHKVNGRWVDSDGWIQATASGAQATNASHSVSFLGDISAEGAVALTTPEGKHLTSGILGLTYFDPVTQKSVWVGTIKSSAGEILPSGNEAVFPDAFSGCLADVLYVNQPAKFEQIIVIRQQLPACTNWGLNPETTLLGVVTAFTNPPQPVISQQLIDGQAEQHLDFGIMQMGRGAAFAIGDETNRVRVTKQWLLLSGQWCLVEQVPLKSLAPLMRSLPPPPPGTAKVDGSPGSVLHKVFARTGKTRTGGNRDNGGKAERGAGRAGGRVEVAERSRTLAPDLPLPARKFARSVPRPFRVASRARPLTGLALDYSIVTTQSNMVFQSDTTYLIASNVNLSGTTVCEGGTCIKFSSNPTNYPAINLLGSFDTSKCGPYKMAVLTSSDDNSAGETISGSSGNPSLLANTVYISAFSGGTTGKDWHISYLRGSYAQAPFVAYDGLDVLARNCQFFKCTFGLAALPGSVTAENVLFAQVAYPLYTDFYGRALNVTADGCTNFCQSEQGMLGVALTNCLLTAAGGLAGEDTFTTNPPTPILDHCARLSSSAGVFQTVGAASYYLCDQSTNRNAGTTNIDAALLADLQKKTTYPPLVYSNATIAVDTTFGAQAQRDTDAPDIGVHYDPIDWVFGGCTANGSLTFQQGAAAAWFRTTSGWTHAGQGIHLADTKIATFSGTATAPAWWVRYNTVQEQSNTNWAGGFGPGGITGWALYLTNSPEVHANFLHCSVLAGEGGSGNHFRDDSGYLLVRASDCEFNSGALGGYVCSQFHTNNLFNRVSLWLSGGQPDTAWTFRNCTHYGGGFNINRYANPTPVSARDGTFDATAVSTADQYYTNSAITDYDYNGFIYGDARTTPTGPHDVIATNAFNWQTSWFGNFYLPTNSPLLKAGWVTADVAGLYHFTTLTNQTIEGTNKVTIGYAYVATDANGNPLDNNGDGIPDYLSDGNNNGLVDSGEIGWNIAGDLGLKVLITRPKNNSNIP